MFWLELQVVRSLSFPPAGHTLAAPSQPTARFPLGLSVGYNVWGKHPR